MKKLIVNKLRNLLVSKYSTKEIDELLTLAGLIIS